jgi:hypothetical protein
MKTLEDIVGSNSLKQIFNALSIAEEELEGRDLPGLFAILAPTEPLHRKSDVLYRSHVRELIARAHDGKNLAPATDAECLGMLSDLSAKAPLNANAGAVSKRLFRTIFPDHDIFKDVDFQERWPGQVDEDLRELRRKLSVEARRGMVLDYGEQASLDLG